MKKQIFFSFFLLASASSFAQNLNPNRILVRHDTTLLKASECEWIIKSLTKNNPALTSQIGKSISQIILEQIAKGKLKAIDIATNSIIPAKKIFTWNMPLDTVEVYSDSGSPYYKVVQSMRSPESVSSIKVYQDWFVDVANGKLLSQIKWIELLEEVRSKSTGISIGFSPLCRIYY